jgi:hypothetical protein
MKRYLLGALAVAYTAWLLWAAGQVTASARDWRHEPRDGEACDEGLTQAQVDSLYR